QVAPADQLAPAFGGDEWIVLDGLHPSLPRFQTRLPSAAGVARLAVRTGSAWSGLAPIELVADTLVLDGGRHLGSMVWRGHVALEDVELLGRIELFAGVELPGYPVPWPESPPVAVEVGAPVVGPSPLGEPEEDTTVVQPSPLAGASGAEAAA